jgi:hypothetical protein
MFGGRFEITLYIHFIRRWGKSTRHSSAPRENENEKKGGRSAPFFAVLTPDLWVFGVVGRVHRGCAGGSRVGLRRSHLGDVDARLRLAVWRGGGCEKRRVPTHAGHRDLADRRSQKGNIHAPRRHRHSATASISLS